MVASTFFLRTMPAEKSANPGIVIISTRLVAPIIQAVSAASILADCANAGDEISAVEVAIAATDRRNGAPVITNPPALVLEAKARRRRSRRCGCARLVRPA